MSFPHFWWVHFFSEGWQNEIWKYLVALKFEVLWQKVFFPRHWEAILEQSLIWKYAFCLHVFTRCCPATILGDPGAVSRVGRKDGTKVFTVGVKEPLGTDSHRTISKHSSWCRLLIGHKKWFVLLCPISEQSLLSSFREFVHDYYCRDHGLSGSCIKEMHAVRKLSVWCQIPIWFRNTVCPKTKDALPNVQVWAYKRYSRLHRSRLGAIREF